MEEVKEYYTDESTKVVQHKPQRFSWTVVGKHTKYEDAAEHKTDMEELGELVKIHRMGPDGSLYGVKVASPIKKPTPKKEVAAILKDTKPARNDIKAQKAKARKKTE